MSSFAAASTIPVTNKVAHANSRKSLRIRVITSPMRTAPCTADVPGPAADVMGIPPTLRITPDGSIGSPARRFFWCLMFPFCSSWRCKSDDQRCLRIAMTVMWRGSLFRSCGRGVDDNARSAFLRLDHGAKSRCAHSGLMPCSKPHSYSITLSARASNSGEMLRPSALAALRLMTRSNLVGCCIGSSPGLAPWRILST